MAASAPPAPGQPHYDWIASARVPAVLIDGDLPAGPDGLVSVDLRVEAGRIAAIEATGARRDGAVLEQRDGMVLPCFVDMHTHIDKGHIWRRTPNPDGTFDGALTAASGDREARWSAEDMRRRMDFALRCAYAHGTAALRTHLDSPAPQHKVSWPLFPEMRERWAGRIDLQAVSILSIEDFLTGFGTELAPLIAEHGGVLGAYVFTTPRLDDALDIMFRLAAKHGLDLDFHSDETADPEARTLRHIANAALRHRFPGRVVCGHCCSLANQPEDEADRTLDLVAEAGIAIVSLPMCNLFLQDRQPGRTPRWRGVTLLPEMRARGIPVAVASDNTRDPFYGYGDLDGLEVLREAVRIFQLDCPVGDWAAAITRWPADIIGAEGRGRIAIGAPADLILFDGRDYSELLSRPESNRQVLRNGVPIDRTLPDYRELDDLMQTDRTEEALG